MASSDVEVSAFQNYTYLFISSLNESLGSNHLYLRNAYGLETWKYTPKFRKLGNILPEGFLFLPDELTLALEIVRLPKKQDVRAYCDGSISDSSMISRSKSLPPLS